MPDVLVPMLVCLAGPGVAVALVVITRLTGTDLPLAAPAEAHAVRSGMPPWRSDADHRRQARRGPAASAPPRADVRPRGAARQGAAAARRSPDASVALLNLPKRTEPSHG